MMMLLALPQPGPRLTSPRPGRRRLELQQRAQAHPQQARAPHPQDVAPRDAQLRIAQVLAGLPGYDDHRLAPLVSLVVGPVHPRDFAAHVKQLLYRVDGRLCHRKSRGTEKTREARLCLFVQHARCRPALRRVPETAPDGWPSPFGGFRNRLRLGTPYADTAPFTKRDFDAPWRRMPIRIKATVPSSMKPDGSGTLEIAAAAVSIEPMMDGV